MPTSLLPPGKARSRARQSPSDGSVRSAQPTTPTTDGVAWALLLFNLGVEAGQAAVVVAAIPLLIALRRASWRESAIRAMSLGVLVVAIVLFVERAFFAGCRLLD